MQTSAKMKLHADAGTKHAGRLYIFFLDEKQPLERTFYSAWIEIIHTYFNRSQIIVSYFITLC